MRISDWSSDVCSSDLRRLQQRDGDPLAWAAVSGVMVAAALRYQIVGARSAFVEAFRAKCLRVLPYARIMIGAVQVEQDPLAFAERMPAPVEAFAHATTDEGEAWEEPPHRSEEHTSELQSLMRI